MHLYAPQTKSVNHILLDMPFVGYQVRSSESYVERVLKRLMVYDQEVAPDDYNSVIHEAVTTLEKADPAFENLFPSSFAGYINSSRHYAKWQKISHDFSYYLDKETRRREKGNPYKSYDPYDAESWNELPDFSRQKPNLPWQFDSLNRDAQILSGEVYELTKHHKELKDRDMFRAKVNSILLADKVIFALSRRDGSFDESEIVLINLKLDLDGYKQAYIFANRLIDSLLQARWTADKDRKKTISKTIEFAEGLVVRMRNRIMEAERRFMLFADYSPEEGF